MSFQPNVFVHVGGSLLQSPPSPGSLEPLLTGGGGPDVPGSLWPGSSSQQMRMGECQVRRLPHTSGGTTLRHAPLGPEAPVGLSLVSSVATCSFREVCVGFLCFPASLLHSPAGAFWDHAPNKLLAWNPCLGSASKRHTPGLPTPFFPSCWHRGLCGPRRPVTHFGAALRSLGVFRHHHPEKWKSWTFFLIRKVMGMIYFSHLFS